MESKNSSVTSDATTVELLTTVQVAELLKVHRVTVWNWWDEGKLEAAAVLPGPERQQPLFLREAVEAFATKHGKAVA